MQEKESIFRSQASKQPVSPDNIHEVFHVIKPSAWLILVAFCIIFLFAIFWGIWGSISTKVEGQGILIKTTGNRNIISMSSGEIIEIKTKVGDSIKTGQIIAVVTQPILKQQVDEAKNLLERAKELYNVLSEQLMKDSIIQNKNNKYQQEIIRKKINNLNLNLKNLDEREINIQVLAKQGLATQKQVVEIQQQKLTVKEQIDNCYSELQQLEIKIFEIEYSKINTLIEKKHQIKSAEQNYLDKKSQYEISIYIKSDYEGVVLELLALPGAFINVGNPVVSLETKEKKVEVLLFIPPNTADDIFAGMNVEIIPATIHVEEYGFIKGKVRFVSQFPVSYNGMLSVLANPKLVDMLSVKGAPYRADIELEKDDHAFSGYKWSTSKDPKLKLSTGTFCHGFIITKEQPPITLVIPFLKKLFGIQY